MWSNSTTQSAGLSGTSTPSNAPSEAYYNLKKAVSKVTDYNNAVDQTLRSLDQYVIDPETEIVLERVTGLLYVSNRVINNYPNNPLFPQSAFAAARTMASGQRGSFRVAATVRQGRRHVTNEDKPFLYFVHPSEKYEGSYRQQIVLNHAKQFL